jgi:hypothetical protein
MDCNGIVLVRPGRVVVIAVHTEIICLEIAIGVVDCDGPERIHRCLQIQHRRGIKRILVHADDCLVIGRRGLAHMREWVEAKAEGRHVGPDQVIRLGAHEGFNRHVCGMRTQGSKWQQQCQLFHMFVLFHGYLFYVQFVGRVSGKVQLPSRISGPGRYIRTV